jgi:zinc transport system ATP-binding protein
MFWRVFWRMFLTGGNIRHIYGQVLFQKGKCKTGKHGDLEVDAQLALLTCQDVSFAYDGVYAVSGVSLELNEGDYLCIVGENGSGKSTLAKGLLRLLQPARGKILMGEGLRAADIGYLPQQTAAQKDFPASVFEVVLSGCLAKRGMRPFYTRRDKELAASNLRGLDIYDLRNSCYRELSGGQQQRALLARALCAARRLLLLDEPVAGLDPIAAQGMYGIISDINKAGIAILMVSHDVQRVVGRASHILHLRNEQLFFGTKDEYVNTEAARSILGGAVT